MKIIIIALFAYLVSVPAFALNLDKEAIVKLLDGKGAHCRAERDLSHRAYLPSAPVAKSEAGILSIVFLLQHFQCGQERAGYSWEAAPSPLEPYNDRDLMGRAVLIKLSQAEAVLVRSGDAGVLSTVAMENSAEQKIQFSASLNDVLSASEKSALESGSTVEARATFFTRSVVTVEAADGKIVNLGLRAGGAYAVFLTMKRAASGAVQILGARLN